MGRAVIFDTQLEKVKELYYTRQLSVREIAMRFSVGMSAVYRFMKKHGLPRRDFRTLNQLRLERKPLSYRLKTSLSAEEENLKMAAVMLYWAEGTKRGQTVDFANSEVEMCKIFLRFLREICRVDELKLRGFLYCHDNQDVEQLIAFWGRTLRLPKKQFTQPYVRQFHTGNASKRPERMEHGLVHIRYSDVKLLQQINQWITEYKQIWAGTEVDKRA